MTISGNQMSAYSAGFSWGFKSEVGVKGHQNGEGVAIEGSQLNGSGRERAKRRLLVEDENGEHFGLVRKNMVMKRKSNLSASIQGQPLPINRGLELLSKEQLQNVLLEVMKMHPQVQQTVGGKIMSCNFSIEKCTQLLKGKLEALYGSIPYSRSYEMDRLNDYAFVRMKPYILEFLNCLIDCVLDQIPPRVENVHNSLKFLDTCTDMVTHIPRFELASNNYYYDKCLEQLSYVWCTVIEHIARNTIISFNDEALLCNWVQKLQVYNDLANGMLDRPLQLFNSLRSVDDGVSSSTTSSEPLSNDATVAYKP
ncbi:hypothetical protein HG537_0D05170 [Torulaspora globosa]|uniref:Tethering factor for nuclear proteasome STS1 n=1 Tax=Torulaspora globosa TaxID=48254 RepID=A0A7H9HUU4_9SACH|nr:hypothetical protein HG537_0D05170 [Torulaspora sp. CBS 2947]